MAWNFKKNKFGNKRVEAHGYSFQSTLERNRFEELLWLKKAGEIKDVECQVQVHLTAAKIIYKPDFKVFANDGTYHYEETKGFSTAVWAIKKRLFEEYGEGLLKIYKQRGSSIVLVEEIVGGGACTCKGRK